MRTDTAGEAYKRFSSDPTRRYATGMGWLHRPGVTALLLHAAGYGCVYPPHAWEPSYILSDGRRFEVNEALWLLSLAYGVEESRLEPLFEERTLVGRDVIKLLCEILDVEQNVLEARVTPKKRKLLFWR